MIALRLNADTSDAQRNIGALGNSIEDLQRKLKAAQDAGNWGEAAKITQDIAFMQNPGFSVVGGNNGGNGSNLQNTTQYNNARQLDIRLETITRVITTLTDQLKESTEKRQSKESFNLSAALNNAEQEKRQLEAEKKRLETADKSDSSVMDMIKKYGVSRYLTQGLSYANQIAGIGFNHRIAMANGDYLGADVAAVESGAGIAQGIGGSLLGAGLMLGATPVGWGLMAAGGIAEIGGAIAKYWVGDARADIAEGEAYRKTLAGTNALNKRFSDGGTWLENSNKTDAILRAATNGANGTGLSTEEFLSLATRQSKFGGTQSDAMAQARDIAMWAQATGTDAGVIQNFLGTARRYGDNSDVLGYASQARQAAGLTKAQNEEFLQSLQSVIEDGIANGYVKSAEDVSKTFVMFSRLSNNNPLWQGEQGAKRLAQMNSGIASATALQSVSDVIVAGAAHDILAGKDKEQRNALLGGLSTGTYIDEMLLMEQGTNPEMFGAIAKSIDSLEGDNPAAQIERYKDAYKLNYHGAVSAYLMGQEYLSGKMDTSTFAKKIEEMQQDKVYQSEETKWQNDINDIATNTALMAKSSFWQNLGKMDNIAGNKGTGGGTANKVSEIAASAGLSPEEETKLQLDIAEDNKRLGLDEARDNGDGEIVDSITAQQAAVHLSDYGEYGKAALTLWQDMYGSEANTFGAALGVEKPNEEFERLIANWIGEAATSKKWDSDVSQAEVVAVYQQITNPKGGFLNLDGKAARKEIEDAKKAYSAGDTAALAEALEKAFRRALDNSKINLITE